MTTNRAAWSFGHLARKGSAGVKGYNGSARKGHQEKVMQHSRHHGAKSWLVSVPGAKQPHKLGQEKCHAQTHEILSW